MLGDESVIARTTCTSRFVARATAMRRVESVRRTDARAEIPRRTSPKTASRNVVRRQSQQASPKRLGLSFLPLSVTALSFEDLFQGSRARDASFGSRARETPNPKRTFIFRRSYRHRMSRGARRRRRHSDLHRTRRAHVGESRFARKFSRRRRLRCRERSIACDRSLIADRTIRRRFTARPRRIARVHGARSARGKTGKRGIVRAHARDL